MKHFKNNNRIVTVFKYSFLIGVAIGAVIAYVYLLK
jgi:hypothetical protein